MTAMVANPLPAFEISKIDMGGRLFCSLDAVLDPKCKIHPKIALRVGDQEIRDKFLRARPHQDLHEAVMDYIETAESSSHVPPPIEMLDKLGRHQTGKHLCGMIGCGREFGTAEHLRQHIRSAAHFSYKFYKCSSCTQQFHHKQDCVKHEKKYHQADPTVPAVHTALPPAPTASIAPTDPSHPRNILPGLPPDQHANENRREHAVVNDVRHSPVVMTLKGSNDVPISIPGPSHQRPQSMQTTMGGPTRNLPRSHYPPRQSSQPYPPRPAHSTAPVPNNSALLSQAPTPNVGADDQRIPQRYTAAGPPSQQQTIRFPHHDIISPLFIQPGLNHTPQIPPVHFQPQQQTAAFNPNNVPATTYRIPECTPAHWQYSPPHRNPAENDANRLKGPEYWQGGNPAYFNHHDPNNNEGWVSPTVERLMTDCSSLGIASAIGTCLVMLTLYYIFSISSFSISSKISLFNPECYFRFTDKTQSTCAQGNIPPASTSIHNFTRSVI